MTVLDMPRGIRSRHYSAAPTAALAYEAEALTPLDAAAIATVTGASGGASNNVVRHANLTTGWTPVLSTTILSGTVSMTHTGTYRVWARVYSTSSVLPQIRLVYDVGDLVFPEESAAVSLPGASQFYSLDLGEIRLDRAPVGTHRWMGMIQAKGASGGENVSIDKVWFQPLDEGAGVLRAPIPRTTGLATFSARDGFDQTAGGLNAKTLPIGGTWSTGGGASDLIVATGGTYPHSATRAPSTPTLPALAGTATFTNVAVSVRVAAEDIIGFLTSGVLARYVDSSNYLYAVFSGTPGTDAQLRVVKNVAGLHTMLLNLEVGTIRPLSGLTKIEVRVFSNGVWALLVEDRLVDAGYDAVLATGGALATGKTGIYDVGGVSFGTRYFDDFAVYVPTADAVLHASQSAQLGTDGMFREDAAGAAYGPVSWVTGDLPRLPPSGAESRPVELFLKASRGDFDQFPDGGIDDVSVRVSYRPSWLHVPGT